jgi:hypothetical protein
MSDASATDHTTLDETLDDPRGDALDVDREPSAVNPDAALARPGVTGLDVTSLPLDRASLMEFTEKFGGPHGLMRWVSMAAGAPAVPPHLHELAEAAVRGEPISFDLRVGSQSFRFDFR